MTLSRFPLFAALSVALSAALLATPAAQAQFRMSRGLQQPTPTAAPVSDKPQLVDAIIAVVNNDVITQRELVDRTRIVERRLTEQNQAVPPRAELQRQLLERMIIEKAQLQVAAETGIKADDQTVDRAIARIAEQNQMSVVDFRAQLEKDGTPLPKFREEIRREIVLQRLREREVDNKVQVTESEVDNYLAAAGAGGAAAQPELNIAQILIRTPENASPEEIEKRRQRAEETRKQLAGGADFAKTAASVSEAMDALKGGELGWREPARLPQLFIDAVAKLKPGEISPVIKSANGFHILKLIDRRAPNAKSALPAVQQTHARHILIKVNQVVSAAEAKRKLLEIKQRLDNKAAKFEDLARLFSNDGSASKGGDLGWIYPGDTVPEFERAMNALKPGEISEPVESPFGYHLIQVLERKTDDVSPERQRLAARQAIRERKIEEANEDWLRQLRDRAYVEYRFDNNNG